MGQKNRLEVLNTTVENIRRETCPNIPAVAINILLSIGCRSGLSVAELVSRLGSFEDVVDGIKMLTTGLDNQFNCAGLIYLDSRGAYSLTCKGNLLLGEMVATVG